MPRISQASSPSSVAPAGSSACGEPIDWPILGVIAWTHPTRSEGKAAGPAKWTAVTKTATKSPQLKSLSEYIQERFEEFSRSQKDVARYIVDHLDEAAFLTAEELARRASTSSSTVVRFSQALGFEGYPELQQAAIEEYRNAIAGCRGGSAAPSSPSTIPSWRDRSAPTTQSRGNGAPADPRTGRRLRRGLGQRPPHRHRRGRPDGLLRQLPAPHAQPARHPRRDRRQHRRRVPAAPRPDRRRHPGHRPLGRPGAPAAAAGDEAGPASRARTLAISDASHVGGRRARRD